MILNLGGPSRLILSLSLAHLIANWKHLSRFRCTPSQFLSLFSTGCMPLSVFWSRAADGPSLKLRYRGLWVCLGRRMPWSSCLRCCLVSFWMLPLLVYPSKIWFLFWLTGTAMLLWLHNSWWNCPGSLPYFVLPLCSLPLCSQALHSLWLLLLCQVMTSVHPWWKPVWRTQFVPLQTGIFSLSNVILWSLARFRTVFSISLLPKSTVCHLSGLTSGV